MGLENLRGGVSMVRPLAEERLTQRGYDLLRPFPDMERIVGENAWVGQMLAKFNPNIEWKLRHSIKVGYIAFGLAQKFDQGNEDLLGKAGLVHDVGFTEGIREEIINKDGMLTPAEHEEMRSHVERGYGWIKQHDYDVARVMVAHEEFQPADRKLYPRDPGKPIPAEIMEKRAPLDPALLRRQQMLALADQVEALMSGGEDRPHKKAWSADRVSSYLKGARDVSGQRVYPEELNEMIETAIKLKQDADKLLSPLNQGLSV